MTERYDVVVVGAGPAGAAAALVAARAGLQVLLVERGPFPGAKNMYGGVVYPRILDSLVPNWWEEAPIQRWVTRRSTMVMTAEQALTIDFRTQAWGRPPYAGATLVCSTTVTALRRDRSGRIVGVTTDRPGGEVDASVVIACDGVHSFCAKEAGLYP